MCHRIPGFILDALSPAGIERGCGATAGQRMIHLETGVCSLWCRWWELGPLGRLPRAQSLSLLVAAALDLSWA